MLKIDERRSKVLREIRERKHTKIDEMAEILGVHKRTLLRDLEYLKGLYPEIVTRTGRYHGGVYWKEEGEE